MESESSTGDTHSQDSNAHQQHLSTRLTPEEVRLLRECNRESFYYRCLPFAVTGITAAYFAVQKGYLSGHPRWGPSLKMTGAAFCGWLLGKISYRSTCEDKFLHLENSSIGDAIRKRRGYKSETFQSEQFPVTSYDADSSSKTKDIPVSYSGDYHSSSGSLNFDQNEQYAGLEERERPTADNTADHNAEDRSIRNATTYDELRKKNRASHDSQFRPPQSNRSYQTEPQKSPGYGSEEFGGSKNKYGDTWEKPNF